MRFIAKINNLTKVLILAAYIVVLTIVATSIINTFNYDKEFSEYGTVPGDEYIDIVVKNAEYRTSATNSETSTSKIVVYGIKKDTNSEISNMRAYVAGKTEDGIKYLETSKTSFDGNTMKLGPSSTDTTSTSTSSDINFKKTVSYSSSTTTYTYTNGEPNEIFIKLMYDIKVGDAVQTQTIYYRSPLATVSQIASDELTGAIQTNVILDEQSVNNSYLAIDDSFVYTKAVFTESTTSSERVALTFKINNEMLENDGSPLKNVQYDIIGKIANTKAGSTDYFNEYYMIHSFNGKPNANITLKAFTSYINYAYDVSRIYFHTILEYENGVKIDKVYYIDVDKLI